MAALMLELIFFPGSASALGFNGELRSRLLADYAEDPIAVRIHELRLTIVEDVLGLDGGDGSGSSVIALLMDDPVPTATPKAASPTPQPSASPGPTDAVATETSLPAPTDTPLPPTAVAGGYCGNLSIFDMKVDDDDDVEAKVRNSGSKDVYLIKTVFEWPDVPDPAYVDYFELDKIPGDDKYNYNPTSSGNSPTISTGDYERLQSGKTRKWETDFDDEPGGKIYGSFFLTLTFYEPDEGAYCTVNGSTYKVPPAPTPTDTPVPTDTSEPTPTETLEPIPTDPPELPTDTPEPAPTLTPAPTETPEPTATPE